MKKQFKVYPYIALILIILTSTKVHSQNILTNGGFESGGSGTGFIVINAGYSPAVTPGTSVSGNYSFVNNPQTMNSTFISGGDHTTGFGNMMVVDGSTTPGLNFFWTAGSTGGAVPGFVVGKRYTFSYWIKSISNNVTNLATQANINFFTAPGDIDPTTIVPSSLSYVAPLPANGWQQVSYEFTATDTEILFRLYNTNTSALGNDFAIDDMSVVCATPPILTITNPATVCTPSTVNLTLPAVTVGSDSGTLTYYTDAAATIPLVNPNNVSVANTYYIKNTASLGCETIRPVVVTIAPPVASPFVTTPINLCDTAPTALIATPSVGHTLRWYGTAATGGTASTVATIPTATGTYFVSQTNGTCESGRVAIQANLVADTGAAFLSLRCDSSSLPVAERNSAVFFDWANDPLSVNDIYSYSYSIQGGPAVTGTIVASSLKVTGMLPGQSATLTLSSSKYPCKPTQIITCSVPCPTPLLKPNFPLINQVYCVGNTMPILSNTSPNGIVGTWSPAVISNAANGSYTFTPDPILHPCAEPQILTVTVNPIAAPTFATFPISVCQNSTGQVLPTSSTNTIPIIGVWSPFPSINTTILGTTIYTFNPSPGQCVSATPTTLSITVNSSAVPTFNSIPAFCAGTTPIPTLPPTSNEGIAGTWFPAVISNTVNGNYQFTPNPILYPCAPIPPLFNVTVTPNTTPTFNVSDIQCEGTGIITLPPISSDAPPISGSWNPPTIDTSTLGSNSYVFTPNVGSCVVAATFPKTIEVYTNATPTFTPITPFCAGTPIPSLPNSNEGIPGTWTPPTISGSVGTINYQFTPTISCSPTPLPLAVTVLASPKPTFSPLVPTDICEGILFPLPDFSNDTPPITGFWQTPTGPVTSIDTSVPGTDTYTFILDAGQCATAPDPLQITVNPSYTLTNVDHTVTNAFEDNQIITVIATAPGNYLYQLDSGPLQTSPIFENVSAGIHQITVSDANGCSASITESNILVIKHPKYFTPNGDGFNDTWKLSGLTTSLITKIYIFDRYGKLLKEISADGTGWDGTYLGVPMPADDYWFTVDYLENLTPKKFKSHFSLKR